MEIRRSSFSGIPPLKGKYRCRIINHYYLVAKYVALKALFEFVVESIISLKQNKENETYFVKNIH